MKNPMNNQRLLKKGKKIKLGNEEFIIENLDEEDSFNEEAGEGIKSKEIILRNEDESNPKVLRQGVFMKEKENSKQVGAYKELSQAKKFKDGFSFQNNKIFIGQNIIKNKRNDKN